MIIIIAIIYRIGVEIKLCIKTPSSVPCTIPFSKCFLLLHWDIIILIIIQFSFFISEKNKVQRDQSICS